LIQNISEYNTCELYFDEKLGLPAEFELEDTALAQHQRFCDNPEAFILNKGDVGEEQ
jgi:hypothetical protein